MAATVLTLTAFCMLLSEPSAGRCLKSTTFYWTESVQTQSKFDLNSAFKYSYTITRYRQTNCTFNSSIAVLVWALSDSIALSKSVLVIVLSTLLSAYKCGLHLNDEECCTKFVNFTVVVHCFISKLDHPQKYTINFGQPIYTEEFSPRFRSSLSLDTIRD